VSSAEGSGSNNPFAGNDVLSVHSNYDNQPDAVFHFLDDYVESVCIEEQQGEDSTWSADLTYTQSTVDEGDHGSASPSVVGISPAELESFNELIKFDHMYFRRQSKDDDMRSFEKSLDQSQAGSCEIATEFSLEHESAGLSLDEDLVLSESDIAQLTKCCLENWLIDSSDDDEPKKSKATVLDCHDDNTSCLGPLDDIESASLPEYIDSLSPFTDDSFVSTNHLDCSIDKQNSYSYAVNSNFETVSVESLLEANGLGSNSNCDQVTKNLGKNNKISENNSTYFIDSMGNSSSPCSSSGCESDFSASTYEDEHFSFSTDIGFMDPSVEPFTELFPALY